MRYFFSIKLKICTIFYILLSTYRITTLMQYWQNINIVWATFCDNITSSVRDIASNKKNWGTLFCAKDIDSSEIHDSEPVKKQQKTSHTC